MIENFIIVSSAEQTCSKFQLKLREQNVPLKSPCLVLGTDQAWVVTSKEPNTLQMMRFGFTSYRSEKHGLISLNREPMLSVKVKMTMTA